MTEVRVGFVTENHFPRLGGMEFRYHMVAAALARLPNVHAAVACSTMPDIPRDFPYPYPVYRAKSFSHLTPLLGRYNLDSAIRRERVNVLHGAVLHGAAVDAVRAGARHGLPVVVQSHGSDVQAVEAIGYGARLDPDKRRLIGEALGRADRVLAVSRMNREMILALGGPADRTHVVPPACAYEAIQAIPFEDLRPRYGLSPDDFVVVTVGRNRPIKRMPLLLEALSLLAKGGVRIKCLCVGPPEDLEAAIARLDLGRVVTLTGRIPRTAESAMGRSPPFPELVNLYRAADLYASVSYFEAFSTAALDAIACGVPVLVTSNHGERDVIREGESGYVLRDETPAALADLLRELCRERDALRQRRERIRASVAACTWDNHAASLRELYSSLVNGRTGE